jgi:hypothetical protein
MPLARPPCNSQGDHSARSEDIGIILVVIGVILWILGSLGHAVRGRRHYW